MRSQSLPLAFCHSSLKCSEGEIYPPGADNLWSDIEDTDHKSCLKGVHGPLSATCFSIQTAMTIGYGSYGLSPNPDCFVLNALVTCQVVVSLMLDYTALGLVWARISRPNQRMRTILFSKNMTLCSVDGLPRLSFRRVEVLAFCIPSLCRFRKCLSSSSLWGGWEMRLLSSKRNLKRLRTQVCKCSEAPDSATASAALLDPLAGSA